MEKKITQTQLANELRNKYMSIVAESFDQLGETVLTIASNELCLPCLDSQGNDSYITIKVSVPKGTKDEAFDGYVRAEDYKLKCEEKQIKAQELAETRARKKEQDAKRRELAKLKREQVTK